MDIEDSTNITGISKLVNYSGQKNLEELERSIIDDVEDIEDIDNAELDDVEQYKAELEKLGDEFGIDLNNEDVDESDNENSDDAQSEHHASKNNFKESMIYRPKSNSSVGKYTEEQKRQRILKHVLSDPEDQKFSVEHEKEEDDKAILLEQIDTIIDILKDERGVDISRVPTVDTNSPISEIEDVHRILRLKNDRHRYCSFAEECILAIAHTLEWIFDGKNTYFGRRPDLRGWNGNVNSKLRRMRYDTSTFVSDIMRNYDLGSGVRIALELLPSLFLYSKMRKSQYADNLITSDEMNMAIDKIRDIEEQSNENKKRN
jgi:hypothetical protein